MKKILIASLLILSLTKLNAQKGTVLVYGSVSYSYLNTNSSGKTNSFSINPGVGYQFHDHWVAGIEGSYATNNLAIYGQKTYSAGGFLRYVRPLSELFSWYMQLGIGYQGAKQSGNFYTPNTQSNGFYAGITPALFINLKKSFGLNFSIGGLKYSMLTDNSAKQNNTNGLQFDFGKALNIGISKNF